MQQSGSENRYRKNPLLSEPQNANNNLYTNIFYPTEFLGISSAHRNDKNLFQAQLVNYILSNLPMVQ